MTGPQPTDSEARREVEELRSELGDTVEELVHRVDVPARLREKRDETTARVQTQVTHAREVVTEAVAEKAPAVQGALRERPALVGAVAALVALLLLRRVRRRKNRTIEES